MRVPSIGLSLLASACVLGASCSRPSSPSSGGLDAGSFDRAALLRAFGTCEMNTVRSFGESAEKLATAVGALAADPSDANKKAARDAFLVAADTWQEAEVMQFGPLGPTATLGGQGLRDGFYAWPVLGRCQTDRATALETYKQPDFVKTGLVTTRGLGALEYLLFFDGDGNGCGSSEDINASGTWAAIPKSELAARKVAYAKVVADELVARAKELGDLWDKGGFLDKLATAGAGSSVYPSFEVALNSVSDALFYIYFVSRDRKLGAPLGLDAALCPEGPCADLVEAPYAGRSVKFLRGNLVGFRRLFEGCAADFSGLGFDDLLVAIGAGGLSDEMKADVIAALAAVDAYPYATIEEGLAKDVPAVQKLYDALKKITDILKADFTGVLKLQLPARVGGDAD